MIIRGTTPKHTFTLPIDVASCDKLRAIYSQNENVIIKIDTDRFIKNGVEISCVLTQEETLKLDCTKLCDIQLRVLTTSGEALAGVVQKVVVGRCLDDEVLV